jgi:hypothetical protein
VPDLGLVPIGDDEDDDDDENGNDDPAFRHAYDNDNTSA